MYFDLNTGNQDRLILVPKKDSEWIDKIASRFPWEKYDVYENRVNEYMEHLFDRLIENLDDIEDESLWLDLTLGQKVFFAFLVFEGEIDNGGVFQFFWNKPEHAYSCLQMLNVLKLYRLEEDYKTELGKYEKVAEELIKYQEELDQEKDNFEEEYFNAYQKGLMVFGEESRIEDYFYDEDFKKELHKSISSYIENNRNLFVN